MKILIVEDNAIMSLVLSKLVEILGHTTIVAADGLAAMELINKGFFDIVITDMNLPKKSGAELIAYIKNDRKENTPVILISSISLEMQKDPNYKLGADLFLLKPILLETLWKAFKELSEKEIYKKEEVMNR